VLRRLDSRSVDHDDVHLEPDQLGGEIRKSLVLSVGPAVGDDEGLTLDVAEVAQPLSEGVEQARRSRVGKRARREKPDRRGATDGWAWEVGGAMRKLLATAAMNLRRDSDMSGGLTPAGSAILSLA